MSDDSYSKIEDDENDGYVKEVEEIEGDGVKIEDDENDGYVKEVEEIEGDGVKEVEEQGEHEEQEQGKHPKTITMASLGEDDDEDSLTEIKPSRPRFHYLRRVSGCMSKVCLACPKISSVWLYRLWFIIILSASLYCLCIIPFRIAFFEEEILGWTLAEILIDLILLVDIVVSAFVPYHRKYNSGWYMNCGTYCLLGFCCNGFSCDLFILCPFWLSAYVANAVIISANPDSAFLVLTCWLKINRLLLAFRFPTYFSQIKDWIVKSIFRVNPVITNVFKFVLYVSLIAHYFACGFYLIVRIEGTSDAVEFAMCNNILIPLNGSFRVLIFKYSTSMYWSLVTMTGYGGTLPITDLETLFSIVTVFIGVLIYVTVIGIVGSMITNLDTAATAYRDKVDTMNDYMRFRKLNKNTQGSIRRYYHYLWSTRRGMDEAKIMSNLPEFLRLEVSRRLNKDMLRNFRFFAESSESFIRALLVRLEPKTVYPESYVIKQGEVGKEMFFLTQGTVDIYVKGLPKAVASLTAVAWFGEAALLTGAKRNASIVARGFCDMWVLKQKDFDEICHLYKDERDRIWNIHQERTQKNEEEKKEKELKEAEEEERRRLEEKEATRRQQKILEKQRIERLKREKAIVFEKRKKRKKAQWIRRRKMMKRSYSSGNMKGMGKLEIWANTKECI